jgi:hypothetical protein
MIYKFVVDDVSYEADVTVTPGHPGTPPSMGDPGDPPEGAEIELEDIWLVVNGKRVTEIPRGSAEYDELEKYLLDHGTYIVDMATLEALSEKDAEGERRFDAEREG